MHNPIITFSVLSLFPGTSDTFPAFPSEVPLFFPAPPTLSSHFRRRSPSFSRHLRHFPRISVGGPSLLPGTSNTFLAFPSEVPGLQAHKASGANPLGFVRAGDFESPALLLAGDGAAEDYIVVGRRICRPRPYIILYIYPQDNQSPTSVIIGSAVVRNQDRPLKTNRASST